MVREAPVKDDAAIGGCTEVHDTLPIARQRPASGAPAKETAHRFASYMGIFFCMRDANLEARRSARAHGAGPRSQRRAAQSEQAERAQLDWRRARDWVRLEHLNVKGETVF